MLNESISNINTVAYLIASNPWFILFTALCSVTSVITLSIITDLFKPNPKLDIDIKKSEEIVDKLLENLNVDLDKGNWLYLNNENFNDFPNIIKKTKVDRENSFCMLIRIVSLKSGQPKEEDGIIILLKYNKKFVLYCNLNLSLPFYRCIADSDTCNKLKTLHKGICEYSCKPSNEYAEEILNILV